MSLRSALSNVDSPIYMTIAATALLFILNYAFTGSAGSSDFLLLNDATNASSDAAGGTAPHAVSSTQALSHLWQQQDEAGQVVSVGKMLRAPDIEIVLAGPPAISALAEFSWLRPAAAALRVLTPVGGAAEVAEALGFAPFNVTLVANDTAPVALLRHIVDAYDALPPYVVFVWDTPPEGSAFWERVVGRRGTEAAPLPRDLVYPGDSGGRDFIACASALVGAGVDERGHELQRFVKAAPIRRPVPGVAPLHCFGVARARIHGRPREEYTALLRAVDPAGGRDSQAQQSLTALLAAAWFAVVSPPYAVKLSAMLVTAPSANLTSHPSLRLLLATLHTAHWRLPVVVVAGGFQRCAIRHVAAGEAGGGGPPLPVTVIEAPTNSFDYTALIALVNCSGAMSLLPLHSAVFVAHDTTFVDGNFTVSAEGLELANENGSLKLWHTFSMGMGVVGLPGVLRMRSLLEGFLNTDYSPAGLRAAKKHAIEQENLLFRELGRLEADAGLLPNTGQSWVEPARDVYGTGVLRRVHHFIPFGFHKAQANWGQSHEFQYKPRL